MRRAGNGKMTPLKSKLIHAFRKAIPDNAKKLLLTISGGADSVALLRIAILLPEIEIHAVHCNFHLRGEESDRDTLFVQNLCSELNIPLSVIHFDVPKYKETHHVSTEMACRELRYSEFHRLRNELNCDRILTAHHLDDNIETLFLNLLRGSGLKGLCGMNTDDGSILRPLLSITKAEILEYLTEIHQPFVTDSTNLLSDVKRNFLRNEIIPLLKSRWPGLQKSISRTQQNLQSELALINQTDSVNSSAQHSELSLITSIFRKIKSYGGNSQQAREIASAISRHTYPKKWIFPNATVILDRDGLSINTENGILQNEHPFRQKPLPCSPELISDIKKTPDNTILYSPIPIDRLTFRHPQTGDRIAPLGINGSKLVSRVLKDAGLTLQQRRETWIAVAPDGKIIWIAGLKRSTHHLLKDSDETAYLISDKD
ncbi:MAG: tRNA lysidine(34) synthetase TilS [Prevotella sp.]|nr:tRNA lysidine(34) synthetase TilS [Bacteroides sp.]MCM1366132.1 tRNA lysidine(34) synthetase TilS [Prevotella sp.]MCM1436803.1 tRNA lysidine(34) synthetase TilS [Prevotella sp.]